MARTAVIIPHWNRRELLRDCLRSVREADRVEKEIVVVDNGSTDGSVEMIRGEFPGVRVIENRANLGFARAANQGIDESTAEYVILLNNDLTVERGFFEAILQAMEEAPGHLWAAPLTRVAQDRNRIDNAGLDLSFVGIARKRMAGEEAGRLERCDVFGASGNAAVFRRRFFDRVGLFDERFFAYCEDIDIALRANARGESCLFIPDAVCHHRESATWGRNSPETIYFFQRNMELAYFRRQYGARFHLRCILPHLAYSAYCVLRWIWRGRGGVALRAKSDALRMLSGRAPRHAPLAGQSP